MEIAALKASIDEHRAAAQLAQAALRRKSSALEIARSVALCETLDAIFHSIMEEVRIALSASRATFFLVDSDRNQFWSKCRTDSHDDILRVPLKEGIIGKCFQLGEIVNVERASADASFYSRVDATSGFETTSALCCPVFDVECVGVKGVVQLLNKEDDAAFSPEDENALSSFCFHIGLALAKFREVEVANTKVSTAERRASDASVELESLCEEIKSLKRAQGAQRMVRSIQRLNAATNYNDVSAAVRTLVIQSQCPVKSIREKLRHGSLRQLC